MNEKISKDLVFHRLEQSKEDIKACDVLYKINYINLPTIEHIMQYFML